VGAGTERVLVVEDEEGIRRIVKRVLERNGYEVIVADSPPMAVELAERFSGRIDVLLTDVVMPQLSGPEVAARVRLSHPETRVLYMSGYTDDVMAEHGIVTEVQDYLPKPFTAEDLLQRVRERLDDVLAG
jgi:two-component system, cell cycle sensor histidine kinase and response regulator CckA